MPCPFTRPKMLFACPNFLSQHKNLFAYLCKMFVTDAIYIVPITNILCKTKRWFAFRKIGFCAGTKVLEEALIAIKFLYWLKTFGPAQNILGPVKGQVVTFLFILSPSSGCSQIFPRKSDLQWGPFWKLASKTNLALAYQISC